MLTQSVLKNVSVVGQMNTRISRTATHTHTHTNKMNRFFTLAVERSDSLQGYAKKTDAQTWKHAAVCFQFHFVS